MRIEDYGLGVEGLLRQTYVGDENCPFFCVCVVCRSDLLTVASSTSKGALLGVAVGLVFPPLALPLGVVGWLIGGAVGGIVGGTNHIYAKSVEVCVYIHICAYLFCVLILYGVCRRVCCTLPFLYLCQECGGVLVFFLYVVLCVCILSCCKPSARKRACVSE